MHLDITLKPGVWIEPTRYFQQISDAGYEARKDSVRLTLTGKITKEGDKLFLTLEDVKPNPVKFVLLAGTSKKEEEAKKLAVAFQMAGEHLDQTLELEGTWKPADKKDKAALPSLMVLRVSLLKPKE